jgi:hypothetical protein
VPLQPKDEDLKEGWASYVHEASMPEKAPEMFAVYLHQYLRVATGDRVKFAAQNGAFFRFDCSHCDDNWNVAAGLFVANGQMAMPTELTDWVRKHEHVCTNYKFDPPHSLKCVSCGWSWEKHAQQPASVSIHSYEDFVAASNLFKVAPINEASKPAIIPVATQVRTLKTVSGRKFR